MKRIFAYAIAVSLVVTSMATISGCRRSGSRQFIERITLRQKDKIPYGTAVAKELLPSVFPATSIGFDNNSPGNWDALTTSSYNQALVLVAIHFNADNDELRSLLDFAKQGNYVFIIAKSFSDEAERFFNFSYGGNNFEGYFGTAGDSLSVKLKQPLFGSNQSYVYPGKRFASILSSLDTAYCKVLGTNENDQVNFLEYKTGQGRIFVHTAPLAFSNYFILHKNNVGYFEKAISVIPKGVERIVWSEYYLTKPEGSNNDNDAAWYRVLFRYPAFKWGLLTGMFMLALYAFLGSRRRQRQIPVHRKPQNDSLDFVKTLGRLYHDRRDHQNLAKKMSVYFLEYVRSTFKLPTHTLDETFIRALHFKSGYPMEDLNNIFSFISYLNDNGAVNEQQLSVFHKQLEMFYQTT